MAFPFLRGNARIGAVHRVASRGVWRVVEGRAPMEVRPSSGADATRAKAGNADATTVRGAWAWRRERGNAWGAIHLRHSRRDGTLFADRRWPARYAFWGNKPMAPRRRSGWLQGLLSLNNRPIGREGSPKRPGGGRFYRSRRSLRCLDPRKAHLDRCAGTPKNVGLYPRRGKPQDL